MTAHSRYITSILTTFSTFLENFEVSELDAAQIYTEKELKLAAQELLVEFLDWKQAFETWQVEEVQQFLETRRIAPEGMTAVQKAAAPLLLNFIGGYPPFQAEVFLHEFLLALKKDDCSKSTIKNYRSDISQFIEFADENKISALLTKPKLDDFYRYQKEKGLKRSTIKRKFSSIVQFGLWLKQEGILTAEEAGWLEPGVVYRPEEYSLDADKKQSWTAGKGKDAEHEQPEGKLTPGNKNLLSLNIPKDHTPSAQANQEQRARLKSDLTQLSNKVQTQFSNIAEQVKQTAQQNILPYVNLAIILVFFLGLGSLGYKQLITNAPYVAGYPTSPTAPGRTLSFQGRLTDENQNPIATVTDMQFILYDALTGGTAVWTSNTCSIDPDQDGIFSVGLGDSGTGDPNECGPAIGSNVFSENPNLFLEVVVGTSPNAETLTPRQPIRTVGYAANAETLQGYPPAATSGATANTILTMNNDGTVLLGQTNPKIESSSGTFYLESQAITLQTASASNGNINLAPDGTGVINLQAADVFINQYLKHFGDSDTFVQFADSEDAVNVAAGGVTMVGLLEDDIQDILSLGDTAGTGDVDLNINSGQVFVQGSDGNVGIGTTTPSALFQVNGFMQLASGTSVNNISTVLREDGFADDSSLATEKAIRDAIVDVSGDINWNLAGDSGTPQIIGSSETATFVGGTGINTTASATRQLTIDIDTTANLSWSGTHTWSNTATFNGDLLFGGSTGILSSTGNVGIGTTTPGSAALAVMGGSVGIGTTSPTQKLTLSSGSKFATEMAAPTGVSTTATTGGTLTSGTYYYKVAATDGSGYTVGSSEVSCTVDGTTTNACQVSWSSVTGAVSYRVYGRVSPQDQYWTTSSTSYTDTGTAGTAGTVPTATTAYVNKLSASGDSWLLGGNVGVGTTSPGTKLDVAGQVTIQTINSISDNSLVLSSNSGVVSSIDTSAWDKDITNELQNLQEVYDQDGTTGNAVQLTATSGSIRFYNDEAAPDEILYLSEAAGGNVGIGTTSPDAKLSVGASSQFQVNSSGDIVKLKNLAYSWPTAHTSDGFLKNDGSGNLVWTTDITATALRWNALIDPNGNLSLNHNEYTSVFTWDTASTAGAFTGLSLALSNDATTDANTQRVLALQNNSAVGGTTENLFYLNNADDNLVTSAIEVGNTGGGGFTNFLNTPSIDITGSGAISGATGISSSGTITFSNLTPDRLVTTTSGGQLATSISSANVAASVTDETGSAGKLVFSTSPTFSTSVLTDSASFSVFNTSAATLNAFGAATALKLGANSGTTTIGNPTVVGTQTTQNLWNTTATTINFAGAATSLNLGAATGTATIKNPTLALSTDSAILNFSSSTGVKQIQTGGTTDLALMPGGNVGIGTTTPASLLHVGSAGTPGSIDGTNDVYIYDDLEVDGTIYGDGSGLSGVTANPGGSDGEIQYNNGGLMGGATNFYFDDVNNYVGIGTTTPSDKLHLSGTSSLNLRVQGGSADGFARTTYWTGDGTGEAGRKWYVGVRGDYTNNPYVWTYGNSAGSSFTNAMAIDNTGNVGIGTTSPGAKLDVWNSAGADGLRLYVNSVADTPKLHFRNSGGTDSYIYQDSSGDITFSTEDAAGAMTILRSGNVGIGTTNPGYKLHVNGNVIINTTATDQLNITGSDGNSDGIALSSKTALSGGSSTWLRLNNAAEFSSGVYTPGLLRADGGLNVGDDEGFYRNVEDVIRTGDSFIVDGNVGIGTTGPGAKLEVDPGSYNFRVTGRNTWNTGSATTYPVLGSNHADEWIMLHFPHIPYLQNGQGGYTGTTHGAIMRFASNYTSPTPWDLGIDSDTGVDVFSISRSTSAFFNINSSGNVGIGTTGPSYKLHVTGDIYANGGWVRVSGSSGLYFQSYGGGWHMTDTSWIRAYNNKNVLSDAQIRAHGSMRAPIFYDHDDTNYFMNPASTSYVAYLGRRAHHTGHLVGSYNNVGNNDSKSNPIYTIGSSYNPADAALSNMYGIGYSHDNFYYDTLGVGRTDAWALYVAADGDIRTTISGTNGNIWTTGDLYLAGGNLYDTAAGSNFFEGGCTNDQTITGIDSAGNISCTAIDSASRIDNLDSSQFLRSDAADVYNEAGADIDLRFEGDTDPNLLFLDASTNRIGIGTASPSVALDVSGAIKASGNGTFNGGALHVTRTGIVYDRRYNYQTQSSNSMTLFETDYYADNSSGTNQRILLKRTWLHDSTLNGETYSQYWYFRHVGSVDHKFTFASSGWAAASGGWGSLSPYLSFNYVEDGKSKKDYPLGTVVSLSDESRWAVTKSNQQNKEQIYGVVVVPEGFISIPKELKSEMFGDEGDGLEHLKQREDLVPVAHLGEASTIVSTINGPINYSDKIVASGLLNTGVKARQAGRVLGSALDSTEHWSDNTCPVVESIDSINWPEDDGSNPSEPCYRVPVSSLENKNYIKTEYNLNESDYIYIGKILVFVNVSYYDPDLYLDSTGNVSVGTLDATSSSELDLAALEALDTTVTNAATGQTVTRLTNLAEAAIGKLKAGLIKTSALIADNAIVGKAKIEDLTATTLSSTKATIDDLTTKKIQIGNFTLTNGSQSDKLEIKDQQGDLIATIDQDGNTEVSGDLTVGPDPNSQLQTTDTNSQLPTTNTNSELPTTNTNSELPTTKLGELIAESVNTASIAADTINTTTIAADSTTTNTIDANQGRFAQLESQIAQLEKIHATTADIVNAQFQDATVSGTLYAANIADFEQRVAEAFRQPSLLGTLLGNADIGSTVDVIEAVDSAGYDALAASNLRQSLADLNLAVDDVVISPKAAYINSYLEVNGSGYIADALGVGNYLLVGNGMKIGTNTISYIAADPTQESTLYLQPEGRGRINLMAGLMVLDETGTVTINGNVTIAGNVGIDGDMNLAGKLKSNTMLTNLIEADNYQQPTRIKIAGVSDETGEVEQSSLEIIDETGSPVATISATGRAEFNDGVGVGSEDLTATQDATTSAEITAEKTSGKAKIKAGTQELIINSPKIGYDTQVFVTPLGSTNNQVLYVKSQTPDNPNTEDVNEGQFVVGFDQAVHDDVEFNWWLVN